MAARKRRTRAHRTGADDPAAAMAESAHRIWLAGLGAFEQAREEGPKMFDALVRQGRGLGGKAREAADQALQRMGRGDMAELTRQVRELGETVHRLATAPRSPKAAAKRGAVKRKVKRAAGRAKR